jgi:hypothetical protein
VKKPRKTKEERLEELKNSIRENKTKLKKISKRTKQEFKKLLHEFKNDLKSKKSKKGRLRKEFEEIAKELGTDIKFLAREPVEAVRKFQRKRYDIARKRLGLEKVDVPSKKKFIIFQIDSISYDALLDAMEKGYCSTIRKLVKKKGYTIQKFNCGLPSMTTNFQTGIMYGDNSYVGGYRFIDKRRKREYSFAYPNDAADIEERIFKGKQGILKDGCSYANMVSGGASRSVLTLSTLTRNVWQKIRAPDVIALIMLNPFALSIVIYHSIREFIIDIVELIYYKIQAIFRREYFPFVFYFPFRRIFLSAALRELTTLGVLIDVNRGSPKLYVTFNGYDELSHYRGPNSASSYSVLREIDKRIGNILKYAKDYDIYILGDHGQTLAVPFAEKYKESLAHVVNKSLLNHAQSLEVRSESKKSVVTFRYIIMKTKNFVMYLSTPLSKISTLILKLLSKRFREQQRIIEWKSDQQVFILDNSSLAHLYFTISDSPLDISEIKHLHPYMLGNIVHHPGVGMVIGRQDGNVVVKGKRGEAVISGKGDNVSITGENILKRFGDVGMVARQLKRLAEIKTAGDLILMGEYENGKVISFSKHIGAHGGIGGPQCWPPFISKQKIDVTKVEQATDLYPFFKRYL